MVLSYCREGPRFAVAHRPYSVAVGLKRQKAGGLSPLRKEGGVMDMQTSESAGGL